MKRAIFAILMAASVCAASGIDGKWKAEFEPGRNPKAAKKGGLAQRAVVEFDLKASGSQLTGTVTTSSGKRARPMQISNGKIEGGSFSFTTVQKGKKAETRFNWRGTLSGDQIKGTRGKEGARRGQPFTARRQS